MFLILTFAYSYMEDESISDVEPNLDTASKIFDKYNNSLAHEKVTNVPAFSGEERTSVYGGIKANVRQENVW